MNMKEIKKWGYRICRAITPDGYETIGVYEVFYNEDGKPILRSEMPKLSWFINDCIEPCTKTAQWDVKSMLKAFRAPILDAVKDFE